MGPGPEGLSPSSKVAKTEDGKSAAEAVAAKTSSKSVAAHQVGGAGPDSRGGGSDRGDEGSLVSRSIESGGEGRDAIDMALFVLKTFPQDEEIQTMHLPVIFSGLLDLLDVGDYHRFWSFNG